MGWRDNAAGIEVLKGRVITSIHGMCENSNEITFILDRGDVFEMGHDQDCCESVYVYDVVGDVQDLVGTEILLAEEVEGTIPDNYRTYESYTFTFYKLATIKGYVDIRWVGESNGYYSESVDCYLYKNG